MTLAGITDRNACYNLISFGSATCCRYAKYFAVGKPNVLKSLFADSTADPTEPPIECFLMYELLAGGKKGSKSNNNMFPYMIHKQRCQRARHGQR